ncbi:MAG TPA: MCE family protein [Marmoricola sp.]|jgi:phospholipid/cholesterol/gamma-HCH transport system substrate-binding protein|nr:MCE family protein [Marmoricola sp.]
MTEHEREQDGQDEHGHRLRRFVAASMPRPHPLSGRRERLIGGIALAVVVVILGLFTISRLPDVTTARLPGAAGGSHTYSVDVEFTDVLDLVPNSTVRLADVPVGRVTGIDVVPGGPEGHIALAHLQVNDRYALPAQTTATIRSTSLLGEKYVALTAPAGGTGSLRAVGKIPLARTAEDVTVEQILGSLGAVLNGGGLQQLSTITTEFSHALDGHEGDTRQLLGNLQDIVGRLDQGKGAVVDALESARRLSSALAAQNKVIGNAVDALDPATGVLARQQHELTVALRSLHTLDLKAHAIIARSTAATVADLNALVPVTRELGKVADLIPESVTLLVTYPFADNSVAAFSGAYGAVKGSVVINLPQLLKAVSPLPQTSVGPSGTPSAGTATTTTPGAVASTGASTAPPVDVPAPGPGGLLATLLDSLTGGSR